MSLFFPFFVNTWMWSFHLKRFHIGICRHFSNSAMVYNT